MSARRPNLAAAGADLAFALATLAAGWLGAPALAAGAIFLAASGAWAWARRAALQRMAPAQRLFNIALALAVLCIVLSCAFWIGTQLRGRQ